MRPWKSPGSKAEVVAVRDFDDFASQRNFALALASGDWVLSVDADERVTPALAAEIRRVIAEPANPYRGFRVPIRSVILGRPFGFSGTQHDHPLRLFRRDSGRWVGLVHETVELNGPVGSLQNALRASLAAQRAGLSAQARPLHDAGSAGAGRLGAPLPDERSHAAADLDVLQALRLQARVSRRRRRLHVLCSLRRFGGGAGLEAPRADPGGEDIMIAEHEAVVASRFDALHGRFKRVLADDDPRLRGVVDHLGRLPAAAFWIWAAARAVFQGALRAGASVVGLDLSAAMLGGATGIDRVRASARRLPFGPASFDGVVAVEVFEHLAPRSVDQVCGEVRRVLRPGGTLVVVDKNACSWNARRPWLPSVAVKWIDERRGLWMYSHREKVRERWFRAGELKRRLCGGSRRFASNTSCRAPKQGRFPFQQVPGTRLFVLWAAQAPGGDA